MRSYVPRLSQAARCVFRISGFRQIDKAAGTDLAGAPPLRTSDPGGSPRDGRDSEGSPAPAWLLLEAEKALNAIPRSGLVGCVEFLAEFQFLRNKQASSGVYNKGVFAGGGRRENSWVRESQGRIWVEERHEFTTETSASQR